MKRQLFPAEIGIRQLPQPALPAPSPGSFLLCMAGPVPGVTPEQRLCQQWLYQQAYQEALAVVRPSLPERDLLAVWN